MNINSKIAQYIYYNPKTWKKDFDKIGIRTKTSDNYTIFNYNPGADFSNPIVQEARGIILDNNLNVMCWPFRKFGNWSESYVDEIDWNSAKIQEKIDGSVMKLWFDYNNQLWNWSTNSMIYAHEADYNDTTFLRIIMSAVNYEDIQLDKLDKNKTYIFELVSPENQVVILYPFTKIWHIGTRDNISGIEYDEDIGIDKPQTYPLTNISECLEAVEKLNEKDDDIKHEGFVVVDKNWNRIKIKSSMYVAEHYFKTRAFSKEDAIDLILTKDKFNASLESLSANVKVKWYEFKLAELLNDLDQYINYCKNLYEELNHNRKAFALTIKNDKYKSFGFKYLDTGLDAYSLLTEKMSKTALMNMLEDYEPKKG